MSCVPSEIDIIIVTYNSAQFIGELLDSLPAALGNITANVIIVDNGSADSTVKILLDRGDCQVVQSTNVGYAGGINRGVRESSGANAILILNPDTRLFPGSVVHLLAALRTPGTGIAVPRVLWTARVVRQCRYPECVAQQASAPPTQGTVWCPD